MTEQRFVAVDAAYEIAQRVRAGEISQAEAAELIDQLADRDDGDVGEYR